MHAFRLRRPWLWLAAACLLALLVAGVLFFLPEAPDGSEELLQRVHVGMSTQEVEKALDEKKIRWAVWRGEINATSGYLEDSGLHAEFRNYYVSLEFDKRRLVATSRIRKHGAWYDLLERYWHLIRRKLGV
jgi:hypothetical protein